MTSCEIWIFFFLYFGKLRETSKQSQNRYVELESWKIILEYDFTCSKSMSCFYKFLEFINISVIKQSKWSTTHTLTWRVGETITAVEKKKINLCWFSLHARKYEKSCWSFHEWDFRDFSSFFSHSLHCCCFWRRNLFSTSQLRAQERMKRKSSKWISWNEKWISRSKTRLLVNLMLAGNSFLLIFFLLFSLLTVDSLLKTSKIF